MRSLGFLASGRRRAAGSGAGALTLVQSAVDTTQAGRTTIPLTLGASPTAGNLLILSHYLAIDSTTRTGPTGFTQAVGADFTSSGGGAIYYKVATGSEGTSYSVGGNSASMQAYLYEYSVGVSFAASPLDIVAQNTVTGAITLTATGGTTAQARELIIGLVGYTSAQTAASQTWNSPYTVVTTATRSQTAFTETSSAGTLTATANWTSNATTRLMVAAFKIP